MLAGFLKKTDPVNFIITAIVLLFFVGIKFFRLEITENLWSGLLEIVGVFVLYAVLLGFISFLIQRYKLSEYNNLTIWLWVMLLGIFYEMLNINTTLIIQFIVLAIYYHVLGLRKNEKVNQKLFNAGLLMGLAYLLYPLSILFLVWIYVGYFVYIKIIDKKLFIPVIGFIIPLFLAYTYFLTTHQMAVFRNSTEINLNFGFLDKNIGVLFYLAIILLLGLLGLIFRFVSIDTFSELESERNYKLIIAFVLICVLVLFIDSQNITDNLFFLFFPASILITNALVMIRKKLLQEVFVLLISLMALIRILFL